MQPKRKSFEPGRTLERAQSTRQLCNLACAGYTACQIPTMKRKRSKDLAIARSQKRPTKGTVGNVDSHTTATKTSSARSCRLLKVLGQYGLLASIAGNLFPKDLYALATTSKSAYKAVFPCKESRTTLFAKMACAGRGVASRRLYVRPILCRAAATRRTHD